jgi:hypothetical protein
MSTHLAQDGITRRRLLQSAFGGAGAAYLWSASPADAATCGPCPTMTVWHLETDWTPGRGPYGKTRLISRASRRAAQHRYAFSHPDALDMNLHLCSYAPASATEVCSDAFMSLWDQLAYNWDSPWLGRSVRVFDIRHVIRIPDGEALLSHALLMPAQESCPTDSVTPDPPPIGVSEASKPLTHGSVDTNSMSVLPFTGISAASLAVAGAGLLVMGAVALRRGRKVGAHEAPPKSGSWTNRSR